MVIPSKLRAALRPLLATGLLFSSAAVGCGDDETPPTTTTRRDSGVDSDAAEPMDASTPSTRDATVRPDTGSPDDGLQGSCAIDSNKIFSVTQRKELFAGMPLAVDPQQSMFALPYVGLQAGCLDVVQFTLLKGGSQGGDPMTKVAIDRCALVREVAATSLQGQWLVAMIDSRQPPFDVWVQRYDSELGEQGDPARISAAAAVESALAITSLRDGEHALVAWGDESSGGNALYTRLLDVDGKPTGEPVRIDESTSLVFRGVSLAPLGAAGVGLAYWRHDADFSTS
jgi:hypothetical protein